MPVAASQPTAPAPSESGSARASPRRGWLWLELAAIVLAALYSLGYDATLPGRLPTDADYAEIAQAIRAGFATGDAVAVAPEWAEKARMFLPGLPFVAVPDLTRADFRGVKRLWLIELPHVPRSNADSVARTLASVLQLDGAPRDFGRLALQRFTNPGFAEPLFDFTRELGKAEVYIEVRGQRLDCPADGERHRCPRGPTVAQEVREIAFAPHTCVGANPVGSAPLVVDYPAAILGATLEVRAGVTGEMGWRHTPGLTPVDLTVEIDGRSAGQIHIPVGTVPQQKIAIDTRGLDASVPHRVRFAVTSANPREREFCFDARAD